MCIIQADRANTIRNSMNPEPYQLAGESGRILFW